MAEDTAPGSKHFEQGHSLYTAKNIFTAFLRAHYT